MAQRSQKKPNTFQSRQMSSATSASRHGKRSVASVSMASRRSGYAGQLVPNEDQKIEKPSIFGVIIRDEDGNDVTPLPLFNSDGATKSQMLMQEGGSGKNTDGALSFASLFQTATQSVYAQPFSSVLKSGMMSSRNTSGEDSNASNINDDTFGSGFNDVTTIRRQKKEKITEEDLAKTVHITLEETETIWMFEQESTCISVEAEDIDQILEKNKRYEELCESREGNDLYAERAMQTFNFAPKHKDVQAEKVGMKDQGSLVTTWDMYDTYNETTDVDDDQEDKDLRRKAPDAELNLTGDGVTATNASQMSKMSTASFVGFETTISIPPQEDDKPEKVADLDVELQWKYLKSDSETLEEQLLIMERIVTENIYQPKLAAYRGLPVLPIDVFGGDDNSESATQAEASPSEIIESMAPCLERLWSYNCPLTTGKNVSCFAWNKDNPDILAVGYGSFKFEEQNKTKEGLACCWNLKNLQYPERVYHTSSSVSAMDFSTHQANLLAVGCSDGQICVFNVRSNDDRAILDSFECPEKHASPVWQLKWIERENHLSEKNECLVSVAADGRVVEWSIRKGLECTDLMKLKRSISKSNSQSTKKKEKPEVLLARQAPGMSFDFHPKDTSVYLAGTEEGYIHKCSCQYNEQFLDTYVGHSHSVYKVKWSPYNSDVFLSCSADWSIKLWTQHETKPLMSLLSTTKAVHDVSWSPYVSTVFCAVNEGAIEIWDLALNTLDPVVIKTSMGGSAAVKMSCCIFSQNSNSIVVGDTDGSVTMYQLNNIGANVEGATKKLDQVISTSLAELKESQSENPRK